MRVEVAFGRVDVAEWRKCARCRGEGRGETAWKSGVVQECPRCAGSGTDPHPRSYCYEAPSTVEIGDVVVVPGNWLRGESGEATVVSLTSDYDGAPSRILRVVERRTEAQ